MPPVSRVTLKDVAARAGVSYQTASKVTNGQGTVGRETEELIGQVVAELGCRTNMTARSLRKQATGLSRIKLLLELNFPFVAFCRANPDWEFCFVDVDGQRPAPDNVILEPRLIVRASSLRTTMKEQQP